MPLEPITTKLEKIFELTPTVRTFRFRFPEGKWIPFKAGQFCMVHVPHLQNSMVGTTPHLQFPRERGVPGEDKVHKKAYSICSAPSEEGYVDLCVKLVEGGYATNWFWRLTEGAEVTVTMPYGGFLLHEPIDYDAIFVATGTGLAPLRSMIKTLLRDGCKKQITLIFGVRHEDEVFYSDEFQALEKHHPNFHFVPTVSRPRDSKSWTGEVGYVQGALKKHVADPVNRRIFVCGLVPMIEAVEKAASDIGFDKKQIHYEKYV